MNQAVTAKTKRFWLSQTSLAPALLAAILPKCPLCLMAYAGILGIFGIDPFLYGFCVLPAAIFFSAFTLVILFFQARRNRRVLPLFPSLAAVSFILLDKFYLNSNWMIYLGVAALLVFSVWLSIPKDSKAESNNCNC